MTLVGSWPYIGLCLIGCGKTAHYGTFRTITAGRDDLVLMVEPLRDSRSSARRGHSNHCAASLPHYRNSRRLTQTA